MSWKSRHPPTHAPAHPPGWVQALLFLEREKKRRPPGEVDGLEVGEDSLDAERKIPLKLMRRGERGGDSWLKGKMVLGEPGLVLGLTGADTGLEGRCWGPREKKPLEGLPELKRLSPCRERRETDVCVRVIPSHILPCSMSHLSTQHR